MAFKRIFAVCLVVIVSVGILLFPKLFETNSSSRITNTADFGALNPLTIYYVRSVGAPGGGGAFVKKTWVNANPWTENAEVSALPVFRNTWERAENNTDDDYDAMEALLVESAGFFGFESGQYEIRNMTFQVFAELDGMRIYVGDDMTTRIYFEQGMSLPDKYNVTKEASYEEKQKAARYLRKKYEKLINMKDLQVNVRDGENNNISLFEGANDLADQIVNYNFNTSNFYIDKDGMITSIIIYRPDLSQKIGDYPLISIDEAKELLAAGHFYGTSSGAIRNEEGRWVSVFPGLEYVKHVELVYMPGTSHNVFMPYYAFYAGSLYYVPAIEPQYITNMPLNGEFPEVE